MSFLIVTQKAPGPDPKWGGYWGFFIFFLIFVYNRLMCFIKTNRLCLSSAARHF